VRGESSRLRRRKYQLKHGTKLGPTLCYIRTYTYVRTHTHAHTHIHDTVFTPVRANRYVILYSKLLDPSDASLPRLQVVHHSSVPRLARGAAHIGGSPFAAGPAAAPGPPRARIPPPRWRPRVNPLYPCIDLYLAILWHIKSTVSRCISLYPDCIRTYPTVSSCIPLYLTVSHRLENRI